MKNVTGIIIGTALVIAGTIIVYWAGLPGVVTTHLMAQETAASANTVPQPVAEAWLGVYSDDPDAALRNILGLKENEGVLVREVIKYSPADKAKLEKYDIVLKLDKQIVTGADDLEEKINGKKPDDKVSLTLLRKGKEISLSVILGAKPPEDNCQMCRCANRGFKPQKHTWLGINTDVLTPQVRGVLGLKENEGVLVEKVFSKSPAEEAKLQKYDVILKVNGAGVRIPDELTKKISMQKPGDKVVLAVLRQGKEINVEATLGSTTSPQEIEFPEQLKHGFKFLPPELRENLGMFEEMTCPQKMFRHKMPHPMKEIMIKDDPECKIAISGMDEEGDESEDDEDGEPGFGVKMGCNKIVTPDNEETIKLFEKILEQLKRESNKKAK